MWQKDAHHIAVGMLGYRCSQRMPRHSGWPSGKPRQDVHSCRSTSTEADAERAAEVTALEGEAGGAPATGVGQTEQSQVTPCRCSRRKSSERPCACHQALH